MCHSDGGSVRVEWNRAFEIVCSGRPHYGAIARASGLRGRCQRTTEWWWGRLGQHQDRRFEHRLPDHPGCGGAFPGRERRRAHRGRRRGTSDGFEAFCKGDTQISDASRPIDPAEEVPVCELNGVEFIEIPIAYDGISVVVNKTGNDWAKDITSEELKTIWEPSAEDKITRWSQVRSSWPDKPLDLYGPGTESGTYEYFNEVIVGNEEEVSRQADVEMSEDDNVLVQGVSGDANALGYFGYSYYESNLDTLRALAVDGVKPTEDSIRSGEYLLSRPLFI